jgi:hypothetical protein
MSNNLLFSQPFFSQHLVSRKTELQQVSQILVQDCDLLVVGAPGIGRRSLIRSAAQQIGARIVEIDFLRTTNADRFLRLLADGITETFVDPTELALIQRWSTGHPIVLEQSHKVRLVWQSASTQDWILFQTLLALPQFLAEQLSCRVVIVFQNFPHIRSWDRTGEWENYLRQEIQRQSRVSYALISTIAEPWMQDSDLKRITLAPLDDESMTTWLVATLASEGLQFDSLALTLFLGYVQGHLGDAIALARRVWLDQAAFGSRKGDRSELLEEFSEAALEGFITAHHVHRSALALAEDLSITFESLILLLPPSQVRVLESLALDPTDKPHARDYIQKHQLSRGGSLQGALSSLEQKGLVYGAKFGYRIAMPMLEFWLKQRLS